MIAIRGVQQGLASSSHYDGVQVELVQDTVNALLVVIAAGVGNVEVVE